MNRYVYLPELDSVRHTDAEIKIAQERLYDEIVYKGNTVVISYNQLTDSHSFMSLIQDEKIRPLLLSLFENGAIKVCRFDSTRTASQYVLNAIDKCLDPKGAAKDNSFIFSALPVLQNDFALLKEIKEALIYTDPGRIDIYFDKLKENLKVILERILNNKETACTFVLNRQMDEKSLKIMSDILDKADPNVIDPYFKKRSTYLKTFIKMIIDISVIELAYVEQNKECKMFLNQTKPSYMLSIIDILNHNHYTKVAYFLTGACYCIPINNRNNRTNWINKLKEFYTDKKYQGEKRTIDVCVMIVNLCYNYVVEDSITGISKDYTDDIVDENGKLRPYPEEFAEHFFKTIAKFWMECDVDHQGKDAIHQLHDFDTNEIISTNNAGLDWKRAARVRQLNKWEKSSRKRPELVFFDKQTSSPLSLMQRIHLIFQYCMFPISYWFNMILFRSIATEASKNNSNNAEKELKAWKRRTWKIFSQRLMMYVIFLVVFWSFNSFSNWSSSKSVIKLIAYFIAPLCVTGLTDLIATLIRMPSVFEGFKEAFNVITDTRFIVNDWQYIHPTSDYDISFLKDICENPSYTESALKRMVNQTIGDRKHVFYQ